MLGIITLALLPLGLIALFASLRASQVADEQRSADLRVALVDGVRKLSSEVANDIRFTRVAANATAAGQPPEAICARMKARFAGRPGVQSALFGAQSTPICAAEDFVPLRPSTLSTENQTVGMLDNNALNVQVPAEHGGAVVLVHYTAAALGSTATPSTLARPFAVALTNEQAQLSLTGAAADLPLMPEKVSAPVGLLGLNLTISARRARFGGTHALVAFLPLVMWASASLIGFFLVDRLLIDPLRILRFAVANHVPGTPFRIPPLRTPAREIRELGETFIQFGTEIGEHETRLAKALTDQTKATREVHHRVKNNLQIIASLISLHARGATAPDAVDAYAAIQRRVDALSIVHRNHYADLDSDAGIDIKGLLGELASNLRAGVAIQSQAPAITISAPRIGVSQDCAVAIAFLLTELAELSITIDPLAPIKIAVEESADAGKPLLSLTSTALTFSEAMTATLSGRYARVLEGLSRQLREPLSHDGTSGKFSVRFTASRFQQGEQQK